MKSFRKRLEETANNALIDKLVELEKQNAVEMKVKIDDFAVKARLWIREEVCEALERAEKVEKRVKNSNMR